MKKAIVLGAGGFIGAHLVRQLKAEQYWVRGVDIKYPSYAKSPADEFIIGDLRNIELVKTVLDEAVDEVYQLAADMGGAGYLFTGENDAAVVHNSALINLHVAQQSAAIKVKKLFFSSSACIYPKHNQANSQNPLCTENSAYPAYPDSEYGWEKLFSERLYTSFYHNMKLDIRIARFHNIYGPEGVFDGGREKAPAALCRKVAQAKDGDSIEVWGDGLQTRSFLYINDCIRGIRALMHADWKAPTNIGSEEMITINAFVKMIARIAGKKLKIKNIPGPQGVRGRCSDNSIMFEKTNWQPQFSLEEGIKLNYAWIQNQIENRAYKLQTINH